MSHTWPRISTILAKFPRGSCPRTSVAGFLTVPHGVLVSCLPHLPFPHSSKPPLPQRGVWSPPQDPQLPPVSSSFPQSQGHSAEVKSRSPIVSWVKPDQDYPSTTHCWKVDMLPPPLLAMINLSSCCTGETAVVKGQLLVSFCRPTDTRWPALAVA